ncbi:MAG: ribonuclease HII [Candidatus Yanofskybacteria bacterium RIFCSPLOWO2_12_FULL_43_11b]|uniref:Ribonuclease HII n=1 Tax=Candidatus Yanofskybacteria bacterium RIFCSPLOWO2_12_FULL_43_11b TaxID=1802710 RepID=A0A1F8H6S5_9BACT|nr:MAG: ribonuclease HII [Candidatus Yanofskybacteria bacterium RIFCSPHIGHO2_01_FULL_43_32]OGN12146.1 MAG: ribonuclease HII [Candidatus Yanofskybacteria bacterium RIFCSPHIGHO2_02_FULL_43_12]OGN18245.1 MAG: ribonuclease HII [Candidatus Yanofskybacteria bacterium RIFCSPHIGHO2_12_FULL_43_11]OGN25206.1 MAG: ribonuclease HII [Candidatus Yanofskybacteria bacterium RIFCSPLOWO2_01_FULL_43_46]OGN33285.1 MAG: ribonuclease HII [Candidatus Yanofskybacteria bacterium RIFCSPLOWO2_12_FULL_43_11b]
MKLPRKTLEKKLFKSGYRYVFGVDEVGMGCLAGPVVVCAVAMTNHFYNKHHRKFRWLRESKLLLPHQRVKFSEELLKEKDLVYAISSVSPKTIDKINIYQAARLGMKNAIKKLKPNFDLKTIVLIDGKTRIKGVNYEQMPVVKGDRKIFAIACASIIAKVYRDRLMTKMARRYPNYGLEKHKGYGTKYHQARLTALGPCEIHRKSFAPVGKLL